MNEIKQKKLQQSITIYQIYATWVGFDWLLERPESIFSLFSSKISVVFLTFFLTGLGFAGELFSSFGRVNRTHAVSNIVLRRSSFILMQKPRSSKWNRSVSGIFPFSAYLSATLSPSLSNLAKFFWIAFIIYNCYSKLYAFFLILSAKIINW